MADWDWCVVYLAFRRQGQVGGRRGGESILGLIRRIHGNSKNRRKKAFKASRKHPWADSSYPWHFALGDDQRPRVFSVRETIVD
jgi:hypothetical protein